MSSLCVYWQKFSLKVEQWERGLRRIQYLKKSYLTGWLHKKERKVHASLIQHFSDTDANNNVRPTKRQNPWANFLRYGVRESSDSGQQGNTTVHLHWPRDRRGSSRAAVSQHGQDQDRQIRMCPVPSSWLSIIKARSLPPSYPRSYSCSSNRNHPRSPPQSSPQTFPWSSRRRRSEMPNPESNSELFTLTCTKGGGSSRSLPWTF